MKKSGPAYCLFRIGPTIVYLTLFGFAVRTGDAVFIVLAGTLVALDLASWFFWARSLRVK